MGSSHKLSFLHRLFSAQKRCSDLGNNARRVNKSMPSSVAACDDFPTAIGINSEDSMRVEWDAGWEITRQSNKGRDVFRQESIGDDSGAKHPRVHGFPLSFEGISFLKFGIVSHSIVLDFLNPRAIPPEMVGVSLRLWAVQAFAITDSYLGSPTLRPDSVTEYGEHLFLLDRGSKFPLEFQGSRVVSSLFKPSISLPFFVWKEKSKQLSWLYPKQLL